MYKKALVAVDGSDTSFKAVDTARQLMKHGVVEEVTLLCAAHYPTPTIAGHSTLGMNLPAEYFQSVLDGARQIVEDAHERMDAGPNINRQVEIGNPPDVILKFAEKDHYDLIIIGNRGLNPVQRMFLGSVSIKVVSLAHCPVLLIKK